MPDPAGQGFSPYVYCGNNPLMFVDPDGEFFVPIVIGAVIGGYVGGAIVNDHGNPLNWDYKSGKTWKGIGVGAASGAFLASGILVGGAYGTAVDSSALNTVQGYIEGARGADLFGYTAVGFATGYFSATGGFGLAGTKTNPNIWGRLATQGLATSSRSIGNNRVGNRDLFGTVNVGIGPFNLRVGSNHSWRNILNIEDNWGTVISNSIGLSSWAGVKAHDIPQSRLIYIPHLSCCRMTFTVSHQQGRNPEGVTGL